MTPLKKNALLAIVLLVGAGAAYYNNYWFEDDEFDPRSCVGKHARASISSIAVDRQKACCRAANTLGCELLIGSFDLEAGNVGAPDQVAAKRKKRLEAFFNIRPYAGNDTIRKAVLTDLPQALALAYTMCRRDDSRGRCEFADDLERVLSDPSYVDRLVGEDEKKCRTGDAKVCAALSYYAERLGDLPQARQWSRLACKAGDCDRNHSLTNRTDPADTIPRVLQSCKMGDAMACSELKTAAQAVPAGRQVQYFETWCSGKGAPNSAEKILCGTLAARLPFSRKYAAIRKDALRRLCPPGTKVEGADAVPCTQLMTFDRSSLQRPEFVAYMATECKKKDADPFGEQGGGACALLEESRDLGCTKDADCTRQFGRCGATEAIRVDRADPERMKRVIYGPRDDCAVQRGKERLKGTAVCVDSQCVIR